MVIRVIIVVLARSVGVLVGTPEKLGHQYGASPAGGLFGFVGQVAELHHSLLVLKYPLQRCQVLWRALLPIRFHNQFEEFVLHFDTSRQVCAIAAMQPDERQALHLDALFAHGKPIVAQGMHTLALNVMLTSFDANLVVVLISPSLVSLRSWLALS